MMTSDAKRALAKTIRELREKIILPDLREATERAYQLAIDAKKATLSEAAPERSSTLTRRLEVFATLRERAKLYKSVLAITVTDLDRQLDEMSARVGRAISETRSPFAFPAVRPEIKELMSHASIATIMRYVTVTSGQLDAAIRQAFGRQVGDRSAETPKRTTRSQVLRPNSV